MSRVVFPCFGLRVFWMRIIRLPIIVSASHCVCAINIGASLGFMYAAVKKFATVVSPQIKCCHSHFIPCCSHCVSIDVVSFCGARCVFIGKRCAYFSMFVACYNITRHGVPRWILIGRNARGCYPSSDFWSCCPSLQTWMTPGKGWPGQTVRVC